MTNKELMTEMSNETRQTSLSICGIIEAAKAAMCDTRCKYPEQYHSQDNDDAFETMIQEQCNYCPLNIF